MLTWQATLCKVDCGEGPLSDGVADGVLVTWRRESPHDGLQPVDAIAVPRFGTLGVNLGQICNATLCKVLKENLHI